MFKKKEEDAAAFVVLLFILLAALALRVVGAWDGYPLVLHPDESITVSRAARMLNSGNFNPEGFNYPSLVTYIQLVVRYVLSTAAKVFSGVISFQGVDFYVADRIVAAVAATLSILMVYLTARRLFSVSAGIFAAAVVALCTLHVSLSALTTVDIWVAVFAAFVLYFCVRLYEDGTLKNYLLAGVCVGLATGSKYTGAVFFIGVLVAHTLRQGSVRRVLSDVKKLALSALASAVVFFMTTPYALLDSERFLADVASEGRHYRSGHAGYEAAGSHSWGLYADFLLSDAGLGMVFFMLALAGVVLALRTARTGGGYRTLFIALSLPVALFIFVGYYKVYFVRNIVGVVPGLAIAAGATAQAAGSWLASRTGKMWVENLLMALLFVAGACQPLHESIQLVRDKTLPNTRWLAFPWIRSNIPDGSTVLVSRYAPPIALYDKRLKQLNFNFSRADWPKIESSVDFVIVSSCEYGRYFNNDGTAHEQYRRQASLWQDFFNSYELLHEIAPEKNISTGGIIRIYRNAPPQQGKANVQGSWDVRTRCPGAM